MAFKFRRFVSGINIVPKTPNTANEMGDLEVDSATGSLRYHNGTTVSDIITSVSTNITILTPPLKFQETGGGVDVVSVTAPANITAPYTFKLPPDMGTVDYVLRTDGISATSWVPPTIDATPTGVILEYAGSSAPAGYKMANGAEYDPSLEPNLFAVLGTQYNTGGETPGFFRVPDKRGRVGAGKDDMGGTPAGRLTIAGSGVDGLTLGATGGTQNHSLNAAENGPHTHASGTLVNASSSISGSVTATSSAVSGTVTALPSTVSGTVGGSDGLHTHTGTTDGATTGIEPVVGNGGAGTVTFGGNFSYNPYLFGLPGLIYDPGHTHGFTTNTTGSGHGHGFTGGVAVAQIISHVLTSAAQVIGHVLTAAAQVISGSTALSGTGAAHQNTQPTIILNYIIKA